MNANDMFTWITARFDEGRTIWITTYGHATYVTPKNRDLIVLQGKHVCVARGKRWDSIMGAKITAR